MSHFIIEHGNALESKEEQHNILQVVADCGATCGFIDPYDIKVRLVPFSDFLALDGRRSFIHITVRLLA
jgi:5-carboxymethyl-2-hydroxymuconate isomerase